ncbi:hypothetical protein [Mycolicibacterium litorale]|uniref:hypothetical protein n=1 Tax=Mycolicibacterium litorale TaxID=758802 RepID=UPI0039A36150
MALLGFLVCVGAALYSAAQAVIALRDNSPLAALTAGGLAVFFCGLVAALAITLLVSAGSHADWAGSGTTVRINPSIAWAYGIGLLGGLVGSTCYLIFVTRGVVELPFAADGDGTVTRYLMVALLAISFVSLAALLRSREAGHLRFSVDGIEYADMFRRRSAHWDDVVKITDEANRRTRNPIVVGMRDGKQIVVPNADRYASSGAALYWMARHYWRHPEDREELADGRALDRLRKEQFEPDVGGDT